MKLLFCIKQLHNAVGGAERVLCTVCSELAARGHEVTVVSFDPPGSLPFYPLDARVRRATLAIGDATRSAGVGETLRRMAFLRRLVLAERPEVAIGFMHSMFVPLAFALIGLGIPVVGSEHIVPEHYRSRPLELALFMLSAPLLGKVTVLSETIRDRYPRSIRRRMVAIPNPVIPATCQVGPTGDKPRHTLLSVGRLDAQKDQATLLRAFSRIFALYPEWDLKIVGEGPLRERLFAQVEELGLVDRVALPGVTHDIAAEYLGADVFVLPSRYEALGLVTVEAMSYGLPVVGFADCPGTNELIEDGISGFLVVPGEDRAESLARALAQLFADPALRQRLGEAGARTAARMASLTSVGDRWAKLLASVGK